MDLSRELILGARHEVLVLDHVDDVLRGGARGNAVIGECCGRGRAQPREVDRLSLVLDVRMDGVLDAVSFQGLEGDHILARERDARELEDDLGEAVAHVRGEGGLRADGLPGVVGRRTEVGAVVALHVEGSLEQVLVAGLEVAVGDGVRELDALRRRVRLVAGVAGERGRDPRHANALALVVGVGVLGQKIVPVVDTLEGDEPVSAELRRVEYEAELLGA